MEQTIGKYVIFVVGQVEEQNINIHIPQPKNQLVQKKEVKREYVIPVEER